MCCVWHWAPEGGYEEKGVQGPRGTQASGQLVPSLGRQGHLLSLMNKQSIEMTPQEGQVLLCLRKTLQRREI